VVEWPVVALVTAGTWLAGQHAKPAPTSPAPKARRGAKRKAPTSTAAPTGPARKD